MSSAAASSAAAADSSAALTTAMQSRLRSAVASTSAAAPSSSSSSSAAPASTAAATEQANLVASGLAAYNTIRDGAAGRDWSEMCASEQVVYLDDEECLDHMAFHWCRTDASDPCSIEKHAASWTIEEVKAVCHKLRLPIIPRTQGQIANMRASIVTKVRAYAEDHPNIFEQQPAGESSRRAAPAVAAEVDAAPSAQQLSPTQRSSQANAMQAMHSLPIIGAHSAPAPFPSPPRVRRSAPAPSRRSPSPHGRRAPAAASSSSSSAPLHRQSLLAAAADDADDFVSSDEDSDYDVDADERVEGVDLPRSSRSTGELSASALDRQLVASGLAGQFSRTFIANAKAVAAGGSIHHLYKFEITPRFPTGNESAKRECLSAARMLDCIIAGDWDGATEILCRRLGGVQLGAETGNWKMCEQIESEGQRRSFIPASFMSSALKAVVREAAIKKAAHEDRVNRDRSTYGSRGNPSRDGQKPFKGKGKKEQGAGSSSNKKKESTGAGSDRK